MPELFLARTEEQRQFRQILDSLATPKLRRWFPTISRWLPPTPELRLPRILLFYGEGGMGKSTLLKRLRTIAAGELPGDRAFAQQFELFELDWEERRPWNSNLQVGHDAIAPEDVLGELHQQLEKRGWGGYFKLFGERLKQLKQAEATIDKKLQAQTPDQKNLPDRIVQLGAKGVAELLRQRLPEVAKLGGDQLEANVASTLALTKDGLEQVTRFVRQALKPEELAIYENPVGKLAEALGQGLVRLAVQKPVILLLDTYEVVDRPVCDLALRQVIRETVAIAAGQRVVWAIAGRANLADSGQRGQFYFQGYKRDFSEEMLYAKSLSEFGLTEIQEYFQAKVPQRPLAVDEAEALSQFSLGMPFVINMAATMYAEGKPIAEIVAAGSPERQEVISQTCDRFLTHCLSAADRRGDLRAVYALAMVRRADPELLREMLEVPELEAALQGLRQRYSFVLARQAELDNKLAGFLREYLRSPVQRTEPMVQAMHQRSRLWLELQVEARVQGVAEMAARVQVETVRELWLDLVHHRFWVEAETGWRVLVPRFVEGWRYRRSWAAALVEVAAGFEAGMDGDGRQWLAWMRNAVEEEPDLVELERWLEALGRFQRRGWLRGEGEVERELMVRFQWGDLRFRQGRYGEALRLYTELETALSPEMPQLRRDLANAFCQLCRKFTWPNDATDARHSLDGETTIQNALRLDDTVANYYYCQGAILDKAKRYEEAIASYQQSIQLDPNIAYPHNGLGNVYGDLKRYDEAIAAYQQSIQLDPNDATPHNGLGNVYRDLKRYDEAIAAYQQLIQLDPNHATPHNGLGNVYGDLKRYDEAIATYQQSIQLDPNFAYPHNGLGNVYRELKRYDEAIASCQQSIQLDPNDATPHNGLGNVYRDLKRYDEAIAAYQKSIHLDPSNANSHNLLGVVYRELKRYEEAIAASQQSIRLDPNFANSHNLLGVVYRELKRYEEAIAAYQKSIHLDPSNANSHNLLGLVYHELKRYEEAIAAYQQSIRLDSNNANLHHGLGIVYRELKRYEEAIAAYQQAIELNPGSVGYHRNLGNAYEKLGDWEQAILAKQKATELAPDNSSIFTSLGWTYLLANHLAQAKSACQESLRIKPDNEINLCNLGLVYALESDLATAYDYWQRGLTLMPDDTPYFRALRALYTLTLGDPTTALTTLDNLLTAGATPADLDAALQDGRILLRTPHPIPGLNDFMARLEAAVSNPQPPR